VAAGIADRRPGALPRGEEAILFGMPIPDLAALIRRKNRLEGPIIEFGWRLVFVGECRRPKREHADVYLFFGGEDEEEFFVSTCGKIYAEAPRPIVMLVASQVRLSVEHLLLLKSRGMSAIRLTTRLAEKEWMLPLDQLLDNESATERQKVEGNLPSTTEQTPTSSMLILDEIKESEARQGCVARIVGGGRFNGLDRRIGPSQLLFIWSLSRSDRTHWLDGEQITVVTKDDVVRNYKKWCKTGALTFTTRNEEKHEHRVQKLWGPFFRDMQEDEHLKDLFVDKLTDEKGHKLFGLRLPPGQTQIRIPDIGALLKRESARRRRSRGEV
jgi:hypothetical protein